MIYYIDPGTGSMLITIVISLIGTLLYFIRNLFMKLKFLTKGEKSLKDAGRLPFVIFSDHKRYWNVFEPICEELEKRGIDTVYMTESKDDPAFEKKYEHIEARWIGEDSVAFAKLNNLNAGIVLSTTPSLDVYQWKRSKNVDYYIHIPHAASDITLYKMFGIDNYDAILLSGEYQVNQIRSLEKLRNIPEKDLVIVGIPYFDEAYKRVEEKKILKDKNSDITVLLAPSWGVNGILSKNGDKIIDKLIETGYKIIVRPHPQSYTSEKDLIDRLKDKYPENERFEWNNDNDNFDVLNKSDIMISDFSGVVFDYTLLFDKPVIYTSPSFDKSTYDCAWIDDELWTYDTLPKIGLELADDNIDNIKEIIDGCLSSDEFSEGRKNAVKETWMYQGEGAVRTVDYIEKKLSEIEGEDK